MTVKPLVFGGDNRIQQKRRHIFSGDLAAKGFTAPGKDLTVAVQQGDRATGAGIQQRLQRWQGRIEIGRCAKQDQCHQRRDTPAHTPDDPPDQPQQPDNQRCYRVHPPRRSTGAALSGLGRGGLRRLAGPSGGAVTPVCHHGWFPAAFGCHLKRCLFLLLWAPYPVAGQMWSGDAEDSHCTCA